jgi:DNA repair ATPase RecN
MVEVARTTEDRIDLLISQLSSAYSELSEVADEIRHWPDAERMSYAYDWLLLEQRLEELRRIYRRMSPAQRRRYARLTKAVAEHQEEAEYIRSLVA